MLKLKRSALHSSLDDPVLSLTSCLNEIISRFPEAISFAPGAPFSELLEEINVCHYIDLYIDYLKQKEGLSLAQARQCLYQYGSSQGQINNLVATALFIDHKVKVTPKAIVITVGCQEAMLLVLRALCASSNDVLIVVQPCFIGIIGAAKFLNIEIESINETEDGLDFDQLITQCQNLKNKGKRICGIYVAPDFSNPSGTVLTLKARHQLLKIAEKEDFLIFEDSTYAFTAKITSVLPILKAMDRNSRVIYLGTFAKTCLPGARVGFIVADQLVEDSDGKTCFLAEELASLKSVVTINTSPICQAIIGGMLLEHKGSIKSISQKKAAFYKENLKLLLKALERYFKLETNFPYQVTWNKPQGGFFVTMSLPTIADQELLNISASEYGVLWVPMANFYLYAPHKKEIRLSCSYLTADQIDEGVRRLALFLQDPRVNSV